MKIVFLLLLPVLLPVSANSQQSVTGDSFKSADTIVNEPEGATLFEGNDSLEDYKYLPDTVFLKTGDRITGKIMSFEQGRLSIDAEASGMTSVKWYKIATISGGSRVFKIQEQQGDIYIGHITASPDTGEILMTDRPGFKLKIEDIIRIFPLEAEWYRGFKGNLGGGVSYTKSSDVLRMNAEYNVYYVVSKWRFKNNFSYIETRSNNEDPSVKIQLDLGALYSLQNRWVLSEVNSFSRNDELGTKARFSITVGGGNSIIQTERQRLLVLTGIAQNSERDVESGIFSSNTEWPFSIEHTVYSFSKPNLSSATSLASYVGITEKGRFRFDANTDITWEFISNFKLQVSFYYNYDNRVLEGKTSTYDYGTVLSLLLELN